MNPDHLPESSNSAGFSESDDMDYEPTTAEEDSEAEGVEFLERLLRDGEGVDADDDDMDEDGEWSVYFTSCELLLNYPSFR